MHEQATFSPAVERLFTLGRPGADDSRWRSGASRYAAAHGLTADHVGELIALAQTWADAFDQEWDEIAGYAPIHAWRALGELRAVEAVEPLLATMPTLDLQGDDWFLEDFPHVFGLIGPPAIDGLKRCLADRANSEYTRSVAAHGLAQIAERFPETRDQVVQAIAGQLAKHEPQAYELNGFFVGYLLDLKARNAAETIERAFSAGVVDEGVHGDWDYVRSKLGVDGLGLPMPENPYNSVEQLRAQWRQAEFDSRRAELRRRKKKREKVKAKRKRQERSRKRSRRRAK